MEGEKKPDILFRSFFNLLILYVHEHIYTVHDTHLCVLWISIQVYTWKHSPAQTLSTLSTDKTSQSPFLAQSVWCFLLAAWERAAPARCTGMHLSLSGSGVWDEEHPCSKKLTALPAVAAGGWAQQNSLAAQNNAFTPSKTAARSAVPAPRRGAPISPAASHQHRAAVVCVKLHCSLLLQQQRDSLGEGLRFAVYKPIKKTQMKYPAGKVKSNEVVCCEKW